MITEKMKSRQTHPFEPVWNEASHMLILGSFPSVRSRAEGFYYGNPQNRFWRVTAAVWHEPLPRSIDEKRVMLLAHGAALWDVLGACDIRGSSDASIDHPEANDIAGLIKKTRIKRVYANGKAAYTLYMKFIYAATKLTPTLLPSTSPANASWTLDRLIDSWSRALTWKDGA